MPEGPELCMSSRFINRICSGRQFLGKVVKSAVSTKNPDVEWNCATNRYTISSTSRGKELKVFLVEASEDSEKKKPGKEKKTLAAKSLSVLFRFGMSGKFTFTSVKDLPKHAHLQFYTADSPKMVLSFVDPRRFGKWEVTDTWGKGRGPCVLTEQQEFRSHVLGHLEDAVFGRPICEALLDQRYFNGVGNYLRAEAMFRAGVAPFAAARSVLQAIAEREAVGVKAEGLDLLDLCSVLAREVVDLGSSWYDPDPDLASRDKFENWLQCYYQPDMLTLPDRNKRTVWFSGSPGPLAPKGVKPKEGGRAAPKRKGAPQKPETPKKKKKTSKAKKEATKVHNQEEKIQEGQEESVSSSKKKESKRAKRSRSNAVKQEQETECDVAGKRKRITVSKYFESSSKADETASTTVKTEVGVQVNESARKRRKPAQASTARTLRARERTSKVCAK